MPSFADIISWRRRNRRRWRGASQRTNAPRELARAEAYPTPSAETAPLIEAVDPVPDFVLRVPEEKGIDEERSQLHRIIYWLFRLSELIIAAIAPVRSPASSKAMASCLHRARCSARVAICAPSALDTPSCRSASIFLSMQPLGVPCRANFGIWLRQLPPRLVPLKIYSVFRLIFSRPATDVTRGPIDSSR